MRAIVLICKYPICVVGLLALIIFTPVVPMSSTALGDPVSHADVRVKTVLTDEDLKAIMRVVRRGNVNSLYEIAWYQTQSPLLQITNPDKQDVLPSALIAVNLGHVCGPLCGGGVLYHLGKNNGQWFIVEVSQWVA